MPEDTVLDDQFAEAVVGYALHLADDELILAHRDSEWTGHAPILEEDIAFSNIAQDELGHASLWYELSCSLSGDDPDRLVFFRSSREYRNVQMVELPKGDWAFAMTRQYLFDAYELVNLAHLSRSAYRQIAEIAGKIQSEELYHYRHTSHWMRRLGLGTEESCRRMQRALEEIWPYAGQLFLESEGSRFLADAGVAPDLAVMRKQWLETVIPFLNESNLHVSKVEPIKASRSDHTLHLADLLAEMQEVARMNPQVQW